MKVLHTSDWHLGKKLGDRPRLDEQRQALGEIAAIADREGADVIVIAGDIYDTHNPSAEAERLFCEAAVQLARGRLLVAVAGNHDDADRLSAPDALAEANGIVLGDGDLSRVRIAGVTGGEGWLSYRKNGERLNLALLSYPTESRCGERFSCYTEMVRALFARVARFGEGFRMAVSHLFMAGGERAETDESTLGSAVLVPPDVVPDCDYCALGHVHRPMVVSKSRKIVYSGSILNYRFGEAEGKSVVIVDTADGSYRRVPLCAGKKLVTVRASSPEAAVAALTEAGDVYAELVYDGPPLRPHEYAAIKAVPGFVKINVESKSVKTEATGRILLEPSELFRQFYKERKGAEPPEELAKMFLSFMEENP